MRITLSAFVVFLCVLMSLPVHAGGSFGEKLGNLLGKDTTEVEFLDPDQAFIVSANASANAIAVRWEIADGYYLYRDNFRFAINNTPVGSDAIALPPGELKEDPEFGNVQVYHHEAKIQLDVRQLVSAGSSVDLQVTYQGCKEDAICYPPINKIIPVVLPVNDPTTQTGSDETGTTSIKDISSAGTVISSQDAISNKLKNGSVIANILVFLGFGLLLAFTPCIFPMVPILSGIIIGHGRSMTPYRAFMLSLAYVLAMSFTYAVLGVIAGSFQINLQAATQNAWIITAFSLVFVLLALSMFGFYELQLPAGWQNRLTAFSSQQQHGSLAGAAVMGLLSAIIVGPCVAPPLAGALIYISHTGDAILGGTALFALGLGMGLPLLVIGTSAGKLLPRAGYWMEAVKKSFGVVMLGVAIWFMSRILPAPLTLFLWGLLLVVTAIYMGALDKLEPLADWKKLRKGTGIAVLIYGIMLIIGAAGGGQDVFQPLKGIGFQSAPNEKLPFTVIKSTEDLDRALTEADWKNQPVMLDFYADWCITCKEMEKYTFSKPEVLAALQDVVLLKADVTRNDEVDQALMKKFGIIGPPAILFFVRGVEQKGYRLVGFVNADDFIAHIKKLSEL